MEKFCAAIWGYNKPDTHNFISKSGIINYISLYSVQLKIWSNSIHITGKDLHDALLSGGRSCRTIFRVWCHLC